LRVSRRLAEPRTPENRPRAGVRRPAPRRRRGRRFIRSCHPPAGSRAKHVFVQARGLEAAELWRGRHRCCPRRVVQAWSGITPARNGAPKPCARPTRACGSRTGLCPSGAHGRGLHQARGIVPRRPSPVLIQGRGPGPRQGRRSPARENPTTTRSPCAGTSPAAWCQKRGEYSRQPLPSPS